MLAGCTVFGVRSGTEQPPYEVIERLGGAVEIRRYGPRLAAEVEVEASDEDEGRNAAFRLLAGYIFGANRAQREIDMTVSVEVTGEGQEIAMTAPVETPVAETDTASTGRLTMRFSLPAELTAETAPVPEDPRLPILTLPARTLAVRRFTGWRDADRIAARRRRPCAGRWRARPGGPMAMPSSTSTTRPGPFLSCAATKSCCRSPAADPRSLSRPSSSL